MSISSVGSNNANASANRVKGPVSFNYNPQDPDVLPTETVTIDNVTVNQGKVSTDTVKLENKKGVFIGGQMVGVLPDKKYKMTPDANGNYNYPQGHANFTGSTSFGAVAQTVNVYNQVFGEVTGKSIEWAFGDKQLNVSPETGEWPNAFYARPYKGVHFFDYKSISTGDSGEIASHETGHAILDAIRPGYLQGSGVETGAFHEAFGDALAMLMTLRNDTALDAIVSQTEGGDISTKRNLLSDMGEGFGHALGKEGGIRTSLNSFVYADPATLPERGDETHLGREIHDFSRLWSGAFYDIIDGISDANRAAGMSPKEALRSAGEEGFRLLIGQMENSANSSETTFKEMANNIAAGDLQFNGGKRQELIKNVMVKRELMGKDASVRRSMRMFEGQVRQEEIRFGTDAGKLAGVKMMTQVDDSAFGITQSDNTVAKEAEKGAKLMVQDDKVLFTDHQPQFGEFFRPNGEFFQAYVAPNSKGEMEFHRVQAAVCDFGHGPDHEHHHDHHGHLHHHHH